MSNDPKTPDRKRKAPAKKGGLTRDQDALREVFAQNLKTARLDAGLSQRALSRATGVSQTHIWLMEAGRANVTFDTLSVLAASLGKAPAELLARRHPRKMAQ
jgi:ribosome-binding protein aMBF1 (putative translation factor)